MNFYLKFLLFFFLIQNVRPEDNLNLDSLIGGKSDSTSIVGLNENNSTLFNATNTPVLFNCSDGLNTTDLSKCTPINITLSYECTKVNYDFLIYSTIWQPKLCHVNSRDCKSNDYAKWRIQGLRATFTNGTRPIQCCSDKQLKLNELGSVLSDLRDKWTYEKDSSVDENIIEDWNLHGSCVQESEGKTSSQLFNQAIELSRRLPIEQWLSNAKIEPSNDKKYGLQFFNYTISSKLNKRFQLRCKTFNYEKGISIIDTINVCVDRRTGEVIDCPMELSFDSNCLEMIFLPNNLIEYKVPEEIFYRDMNYYRYNNYHRSYSPLSYGHSYGSSGLLTGALLGAGGTAALTLPAAYYYFKNQNKHKNKYSGYGGMGPGGFGGSMPWYASSSYANSFAPPPSYGTPKNFGNLSPGGYNMHNNLYPKQSYPSYSSPNFLPPSVYSGVQNNPKTFGNLNVPDLSPGFYNANGRGNSYPPYNSYPNSNPLSHNNLYPSYPPYSSNTGGINPPSYPAYPSNNNPSYPSYPSNNKPSYPPYPSSGNLPQAPPPYSKDGKDLYPKQSSPYDKPPSYSSLDKNKPSYPSYPNTGSNKDAYKPSAPSFSDLNDKPKSGGSLYPKLPNDSNGGKYSPSAPSYPSSGNKPSSASKPKSTGIFGNLFSRMSGGSSSSKSNGYSSGRSGGSRGGGSRGGGGRSRG